MALLSLRPSRLVKLAAAVEGRGTPTRTALVPRDANVHSLSLERRARQHGSGWKRSAVGHKLDATLSPSEPCATKLTLDASNGALRRLACSDGTVRHFEGGSDGAPLIETTPLATQPPLSPSAVARQPGFYGTLGAQS